MKRLFGIGMFLLFPFVSMHLFAQDVLSGNSGNEYSKIDSVSVVNASNPDTVWVDNPSLFEVDDVVMLYMVNGLEFDRADGSPGDYGSSTGKYVFVRVAEKAADRIVFNASTDFFNPYDNFLITEAQRFGWQMQLIKVPEYDNLTINGDVTASGWDSATGTGGVLTLYVRNKLRLEADIDMSVKGFSGAKLQVSNAGADCFTFAGTDFKDRHYTVSASDSAGLKGEGPVFYTNSNQRGFGRVLTAGGGGNGKYSGGGGGGNMEAGGKGGSQSNICAESSNDYAGEGGYALKAKGYYTTTSAPFRNRIFFGGGGGAGIQDIGSGFLSSSGGNGGGLVVIIADTIETIGSREIRVDGESVTDVATGAGGGGGAGGCIVLQVNGYINTLKLSARGGEGGSTNHGTFTTGAGGGGSGGVFWLSATDHSALDIDTTATSRGAAGVCAINPPGNAIPGNRAQLNPVVLEAPLNGLVINPLPDDRRVCSNVIPDIIDAAPAEGGSGSPAYQWIVKTDITPWAPAGATGENYTFSAPLDETTYFARVVTMGTLTDTSNVMTIVVVDSISGNTIATDDRIVCEGTTMLPFYPNATLQDADVSNDTAFSWEWKIGAGGSWELPGNTNDLRTYQPPLFTASEVNPDSVYFRRKVSSDVCQSISNEIGVKVYPAITSNSINTAQDTLCYDQAALPFTGSDPLNGDGSYTYVWEMDELLGGGFQPIEDSRGDKSFALIDSTLKTSKEFRRVVYSSLQDSSCMSISDTIAVEVLKDITNNTITSDVTICQNTAIPGAGLTGSTPQDGNPGSYSYNWETSDDLVTWVPSGTTVESPYNETFTNDGNFYVRRVVFSGEADACKDTSNFVTVDVVKEITGNNSLVSVSDTYCEEFQFADSIDAAIPQGEPGQVGIRWEIKENDTWNPAPGVNDKRRYLYEASLVDTFYLRRVAYSRLVSPVCTVISDSIEIAVLPKLENNLINTTNIEQICFGYALDLQGTSDAEISGGTGAPYTYEWIDASETTLGANQNFTDASYTTALDFRRVVISGPGDECKDTSLVAPIPVRALPTATIALADPADAIICESDIDLEITITSDSEVEHTAEVNYSSTFGSGTVSASAVSGTGAPLMLLISPETNDSTNYTYQLATLVDEKGCAAEPANLTGSAQLLVYEQPDAQILTAPDQVCADNVDIVGSDPNGADIFEWFQLDAPAVVMFGDPTATATNMSLTVDYEAIDNLPVELGWRLVTNAGCGDTATQVVTFYDLPDSTRLTADTVKFYTKPTYDLSQLIPALDAGSAVWTVGDKGGAVNGSISSEFVYAQEHDFIWVVTNGNCVAQDDTVTVIQYDLRQYEGFSPNGDGLNDQFVIPGLIEADDFTFILYNTWGTKIKEINKSDLTSEMVEIDGIMLNEYLLWDGTGEDGTTLLPTGTYYYNIQYSIGGESYEPKKGFIVLRY